MDKWFPVVLVLAVVFASSASSLAQEKFSLGVGADVAIPTGDFGDAYNVGFGGTVRGQYAVHEQVAVMLTAGYLTFSGKDLSIPGSTTTASLDNGSMIPIVVGAKAYFMPGNLRVYGAFDIGITATKVGASAVNPLTGQTVSASATSTEFTYQPQLGFESNLGSGNTKLDAAVRWIGISDANSIGFRVGLLFGVGQ